MVPPAQGITQFGTVGPGNTPQQAPYGQQGPASNLPAGMTYSLPLFSTEQGPQNLERMALPPGPPPSPEQAAADPGFIGTSPFPEVPVQPPYLPDMGLQEAPLPVPPVPLSSTSEPTQQAPEPAPIFPATPPLEAAIPPPTENVGPSVEDPSDLAELNAYLASLNDMTKAPEPQPPEAPIPEQPSTPPVPEQSPSQPVNQITMQCHSCGANYTAEIAQFPALVTCPVCQTQGMIESS